MQDPGALLSYRSSGCKLRVATDHGPAAYDVPVLSAQELKLQMLCRIAVEYTLQISAGGWWVG